MDYLVWSKRVERAKAWMCLEMFVLMGDLKALSYFYVIYSNLTIRMSELGWVV